MARIGIQENLNAHPAIRWLAVVLWMGVIFTLSAIPSLSSPLKPFYDVLLRKLAHIAEYAILTALLLWALRPHLTSRAHGLLMAAVIALLYACSDEWHQSFVPGREGSIRDVGVDGVGVMGVSLWFVRTRVERGGLRHSQNKTFNRKEREGRKDEAA
jgi:VanZ family protein